MIRAALTWLWRSGDLTEVSLALFAAPMAAGIVVLWVCGS
jgi:hypothetical protein